MRIVSAAATAAREFLAPKFNLYLVVCLLIIGGFLALTSPDGTAPTGGGLVVNYFYLPTCPHCAEQRPVINELQAELPDVTFAIHDASSAAGASLFYELAVAAGMDNSQLAVPTTFVGKRSLVGVHSKEAIREAITDCQKECVGENRGNATTQAASTGFADFELPFLGRTDLMSFSLPVLAVVLGLVDGFNPCAMWVLVYLIALIMNLGDRKKIWVIAGSFVLASGVLYFLFMAAWLNAFLLLGYIRLVTIAIGLVALGGGILSLKDYLATKGALVCKVGDGESHKKTIGRMESIIAQPLSIGVIAAIVALAFVVNSVEFVCSSAIPAVFTQILALSGLSPLEHYAYIALYDLFFMLDDLIIFGLAAFAVSSGIGEKYAKYCKALGGIILLVLGLLLLFAPQLLR
jgi:thiol-disulfide isomerase/thioredoxin